MLLTNLCRPSKYFLEMMFYFIVSDLSPIVRCAIILYATKKGGKVANETKTQC